MCMFWKRFMKCETKPAEDVKRVEVTENGWDSLVDDIEAKDAEIKSLKQQLTHKTDLADAHKEKYEREQARVAELISENNELQENYERLFGRLSDVLWAEVDEEPDDETDADSELPTLSSLAGIGIADRQDIATSPDSEETQVFDRSAVNLPDGFVDSAGYGEA